MKSKLFAAVEVRDADDVVRVQLPGSIAWRRLVSINAVPATRLLALAREQNAEHYGHELNAMLPALMAATDAPLPDDGSVDVCVARVGSDDATAAGKDGDDGDEHVQLHYSAAARQAAQAAVRSNLAGILAVGKAAGLSEAEVSVLFGATMLEFAKAAAAGNDDDDDDDNGHHGGGGGGVNLHDMMGNMMGNMMGAAGAAAGAGGPAGHGAAGQNCQAQ